MVTMWNICVNSKPFFSILDYDIGGEEFCDDQLKAYFEHLVLPEIEDAEEHGDYIKSMELPPEQVSLNEKSVTLILNISYWQFHLLKWCSKVGFLLAA